MREPPFPQKATPRGKSKLKENWSWGVVGSHGKDTRAKEGGKKPERAGVAGPSPGWGSSQAWPQRLPGRHLTVARGAGGG